MLYSGNEAAIRWVRVSVAYLTDLYGLVEVSDLVLLEVYDLVLLEVSDLVLLVLSDLVCELRKLKIA